MKYPDWNDFENGRLLPAEMKAAEDLLATDELARRDHAAFLEYRMTLRQAALAEPTPTDRLEGMLRKAVPARRVWPRWASFAGAGLSLIAAAVFVPRMLPSADSTPKLDSAIQAIDRIAELKTSDPREASNWVRANSAVPAPTYRLTGLATMTGAEVGRGWVAYDYNCGGKPVRLVIRKRGEHPKDAATTTVGNTKFFVGKAVGWECPSCYYEVVGCDEGTRWKLAKAAVKELFGHL